MNQFFPRAVRCYSRTHRTYDVYIHFISKKRHKWIKIGSILGKISNYIKENYYTINIYLETNIIITNFPLKVKVEDEEEVYKGIISPSTINGYYYLTLLENYVNI